MRYFSIMFNKHNERTLRLNSKTVYFKSFYALVFGSKVLSESDELWVGNRIMIK